MDIKTYLRPVLGGIALLLGLVFSFIPVIPVLGIVGLVVGSFLLAPYIPVLGKLENWIKKKDSSGKTEQAERKVEEKIEQKQKQQSKQKEKER